MWLGPRERLESGLQVEGRASSRTHEGLVWGTRGLEASVFCPKAQPRYGCLSLGLGGGVGTLRSAVERGQG